MGRGNYLSCDPTYNCFPTHLNAYHKKLLGWIPSARQAIFPSASGWVYLERLGQPYTAGQRWMAQVPIPNSTSYYTMEVRRRGSPGLYEADLPAEGVVIHKIIPGDAVAPSRAVVPDGTCTAGDDVVALNAGQRFDDHANAIRITVQSEDSVGANISVETVARYAISVTRNGPGRVSASPTTSSYCGTTTCNYYYNPGAVVTLTARPDNGAAFTGWSNCPAPSGTTCTVVADASKAITANFEAVCPVDDECYNQCLSDCHLDGLSNCPDRCRSLCVTCP